MISSVQIREDAQSIATDVLLEAGGPAWGNPLEALAQRMEVALRYHTATWEGYLDWRDAVFSAAMQMTRSGGYPQGTPLMKLSTKYLMKKRVETEG